MVAPAEVGPRSWLDAPLEERTILHVLRSAAEEVGDRPAIVDESSCATYAELYERSCAVAGGLRALGPGAADRVLIMMENHLQHALGWFGTNLAGGAEVPINTALRGEQLAYVVNHSEARVVVVDGRYVERFRHIEDLLTSVEHVVVHGDSDAELRRIPSSPFASLAAATPVPPVPLHPWGTSAIMYTSGTTGRPKGVLVSHAQTYGRMWPLNVGAPRQGDTTLVSLPIYHVIGQCRGLYNTLIAHGTTVLEERFSASSFWDTCRTHGVTYAPLVGAMASYLLAQPPRPDDRDNPVERICIGTTIPEVDEFAARFDVELATSYGLTEVGGILVGPAQPSGCGYVRPDYEARLVDEYDREVAPGEPGELVVRGREPWTVMQGYLKNPDATAEKWRNLWLHTGDLMSQRPDGEFVFVGRRTEAIRRRGENISALEVEEGVLSHAAVKEVAVVGIDVDGETELKAVVVPEPGQVLELPRLVEHLAEELAYYMVPRFFQVVDELPRTESTHRVQKAPLREGGAADSWDREAAGLVMTRQGLRRHDPRDLSEPDVNRSASPSQHT